MMIPSQQMKIKTSNFYNKQQLQQPPFFPRRLTTKQLPAKELEKAKTMPKQRVKTNRKSPPSTGTSDHVKKHGTNIYKETTDVLFSGKEDDSPEKCTSFKNKLKSVPLKKDLTKKRSSVLENNSENPHKKQKLDINEEKMISSTDNRTSVNIYKCTITVQHEANQNSPIRNKDINNMHKETRTSPCRVEENKPKALLNGTKNESKATKQQNLKTLFKTLEKTQEITDIKTQEHQDERFRILDESSQTGSSSPVLFNSNSSSSGLGSSPNSIISSPNQEQQSSITKYFSLKAEFLNSPHTRNGISPKRTRNGRQHLGTGKDALASSSPASNKKAQMYLDLGQKDFGHVTCPTCNMVYTRAQPEDEADHFKFHQKFVTCLRFKGWKTERVLEHYDDGRAIVVLPNDHFTHLRKVADVRSVVDNELGFSSETSYRMQDAKTYMFIINKKVVGCIVAVDIQEAYPILPSEQKENGKTTEVQGALCCSSTPVRAQCGISRVWVLKQYRRQGIATRLLDCVRNHFIYGCIVGKESLAFSDPTPVGKQLAEAYIGSKKFLVFR